jgi:hypothetical protein
MWKSIYQHRTIIYAMLLCFLLFPQFFKSIQDSPFHGDESHWTHFGAKYFDLFFLQRAFDDVNWHTKMGVDQPQIGRYLVGMSLWLSGGEPLLEKAYHSRVYDFGKSRDWNLKHDRISSMDIIAPVRSMMAVFGFCTCLLLYFIGARLVNPESGFLAGILLGFNPLLLLQSRRAMTDAPLLFFMTAVVTLLPALLYCYRQKHDFSLYSLCCLMGIMIGCAAGVKLNGGLIGIIFAAWIVLLALEVYLYGGQHVHCLPLSISDQGYPLEIEGTRQTTCFTEKNQQGRTRQILNISAMAAITGAAAILTFYISSPNLYDDPVSGIKQMVDHRMKTVSGQQSRQPQNAIHSFSDKLRYTYLRMFYPPTNYSVFKIMRQVPLELFFLLFGVALLFVREYRQVRNYRFFSLRSFVVIWALFLYFGISAWIPIDWGRYYLPMFPAQALLVASGVVLFFGWIFRSVWSLLAPQSK